jgi:FkbM family methyltransferase
MKLFLKRVLGFFRLELRRIPVKRSNSTSIQSIRVIPWFEKKGDQTLRLNYNLEANSVVFDLGGYEGEWASNIYCKYGSNIFIFEPYEEFFRDIQIKFSHNTKIKTFNFGLAGSDRIEKLFIDQNSSSIFNETGIYAQIQLKSIFNFFNEFNLSNVDLMKINIEGGEFELLEALLETDLILVFDNIQVQFHDFVPNADSRMLNIQNKLSRTHFLTYQFEYVWENWKRK